ncbi:MAG: hypothetical protein CSA75_04700, partial [Sorangium cellulosum]
DLSVKRLGFEVDPKPEGKIIERVEMAVLEVFEPRDPAPGFLNSLHIESRPYTIERELLVGPGDRYEKILVDETARNIRALPQFSLVICVAVRGSNPDKVVLLVIAKDVWSIRMNSEVSYTSGGLEKLILQPAETNLLGSHQTMAVRYELDPMSWSGGLQYIIPCFSKYHLHGSAQANLIINRESGQAEGSYGSFLVGRRLLSSRTPWSWLSKTFWLYQTSRRFVNAKLAIFDADVTPEDDKIPYEYRTRAILHRTGITRSYGWAIKNNITFGVEYDQREYEVSDSTADPRALREFEDERVPTTNTRLSPYIQYSGYSTDFVRVLDFETLGLQEDYRLGHQILLKVYPAFARLGSTRNLFGVFAAAQYTVPFIDGLARVGVESVTEMDADGLSDASIKGNWRVITPRLGFGRLLVDSIVLRRYRNSLNQNSYLGGNTRLRGYPSSFFVGENTAATNIEFRSRPIEIFSMQFGGTLFYDVGTAFDENEPFDINQSVGLGTRSLFPQLDRVVFRVDVGFPLDSDGLASGVSPMS